MFCCLVQVWFGLEKNQYLDILQSHFKSDQASLIYSMSRWSLAILIEKKPIVFKIWGCFKRIHMAAILVSSKSISSISCILILHQFKILGVNKYSFPTYQTRHALLASQAIPAVTKTKCCYPQLNNLTAMEIIVSEITIIIIF